MQTDMLTQYVIEVPNEPGMLAGVTEVLAKHKISINGLMSASVGESASIQFLAPKDSGLRIKLERSGIPVKENEVFHVEIPNRVDELYKLAKKLGKENINILSLYGSVDGRKVKLLLVVDLPQDAGLVLKRLRL